MTSVDPQTRLLQFADDTTQPAPQRVAAKVAAYEGGVDPTGMTDEELLEELCRWTVSRAAAYRPDDGPGDLPKLRARLVEMESPPAREAGQ